MNSLSISGLFYKDNFAFNNFSVPHSSVNPRMLELNCSWDAQFKHGISSGIQKKKESKNGSDNDVICTLLFF